MSEETKKANLIPFGITKEQFTRYMALLDKGWAGQSKEERREFDGLNSLVEDCSMGVIASVFSADWVYDAEMKRWKRPCDCLYCCGDHQEETCHCAVKGDPAGFKQGEPSECEMCDDTGWIPIVPRAAF